MRKLIFGIVLLLAAVLCFGSVVLGGPQVLEVSPTYLEFTAYKGGANPANQILSIWNSGHGPMGWTVSEDCNWVVVEPNSGSSLGEVDDVNVAVGITGLSAGTYNCQLSVDAGTAANSPQVVDVNLIIYGVLRVPSDYPTIQAGIDSAEAGEAVIVWPGVYNENIVLNGTNIIVRSTDPNDPCVVAATVIQGDGTSSVVTFTGNEEPNCVLSGFTITGGGGTGGGPGNVGGGITGGVTGGSKTLATITKCVITGNEATRGGGIYYCDGLIKECIITGNTGGTTSGGIRECNGNIVNCIISGNTSRFGGGLTHCDGNIINCRIEGNSAQYGGGLRTCSAAIVNCIISGNRGYQVGGVCSCDGNIVNCSIVGNRTEEYGGGLGDCYGAIKNCIIRDNFAGLGGNQLHYCSTPTYSCIEDVNSGLGNIGADPCFAEPGYWGDANDTNIPVEPDDPNAVWVDGDYHLKSAAGRWDANSESWVTDTSTSPCIDAGNPGCPLGNEPNDVNNVRVNMGAYGGTAEASKSPANWALLADLTNDRVVDSIDLGVFVNYWLESGVCIASDLDRNEFVDFADFDVFAQQWLDISTGGANIEYEITACGMWPKAAEVSGETRFSVTVVGSYIHFEDMMEANCCPDELLLEMDVQGDVITIYEIEHTTMPCLCICDNPVTATLGPFEPGTYTLEVYEDHGGFIGSTIVSIGQ